MVSGGSYRNPAYFAEIREVRLASQSAFLFQRRCAVCWLASPSRRARRVQRISKLFLEIEECFGLAVDITTLELDDLRPVTRIVGFVARRQEA